MYGSHRRVSGAEAAVILAAAVAIAAESDSPPPALMTTNVYVNNGAWSPPPAAPLPQPIVTAPDPARRPFDSAAALHAIHEVDLAACVARGAPRGYGHAQLTFAPNGGVSKVLIDAPSGLSKDAVDCVGERLSRVAAPEFDGSAVSAGASFYVK